MGILDVAIPRIQVQVPFLPDLFQVGMVAEEVVVCVSLGACHHRDLSYHLVHPCETVDLNNNKKNSIGEVCHGLESLPFGVSTIVTCVVLRCHWFLNLHASLIKCALESDSPMATPNC